MAKNDLKTLQELAQVVTRNKAKSIDTLAKKSPESKVHEFYERLLSDSFANDAEAADYFYEDNKHQPQYRKLKNKLKEKLINSSFFIDINTPKFNTHQRAYYTCLKNLMAVRILLGRYARKPGIELALTTLKKAQKYEFPEIAAELCRMIRSHFATQSKNEAAYERYAALAIYYKKMADAEELAIARYEHTSILLRRSKNEKKVIDLCRKYELELRPLLDEFKSFRLHLWSYFIAIRAATLLKDNHRVISLCDGAIEFMNHKGFVSDQFTGALFYQKLMALIQIRDFSRGQDVALKCSSIFEENTIRWYTAFGYSFLFMMHSGQYHKAIAIREKVVTSKSFLNQYQNRSEIWRLHDAYLYYLHLCGRLHLNKGSSIANFRIQKFLNEVPVFSMDKSGYNIPILIIQILILIHQKKHDQLTDKVDAIEKYTTRYLRKDNNYRSNCFIKMLLQIPKQQFHRFAVERHTRNLLEKLKAMPLEKANQPFEIEIIPYEHLWEMTLDSLRPKAISEE